MIYRCLICGHIHNEESTGISLDKLDKCPICGQEISNFVEDEKTETQENTQNVSLAYPKHNFCNEH